MLINAQYSSLLLLVVSLADLGQFVVFFLTLILRLAVLQQHLHLGDEQGVGGVKDW